MGKSCSGGGGSCGWGTTTMRSVGGLKGKGGGVKPLSE